MKKVKIIKMDTQRIYVSAKLILKRWFKPAYKAFVRRTQKGFWQGR